MGVNGVNGTERPLRRSGDAAPAPQLRTNEAGSAAQRAERVAEPPKVEQVLSPRGKKPEPIEIDSNRARFRVDKESNRIIAQVIGENNEVIREIPPEELLQFNARFRRLQGLLFDERA